jgi:hypothetical protein
MLHEDLIVKNYADFKSRLETYVGLDECERLITLLGGEEKIMDASFANTNESGLAYRGSLVQTALNITTYAVKINQLLPKNKQAKVESIVKVGFLHHLAKVLLYEPNDNIWEIANRGIVYKYNTELEGALRVGERSTLIACNAGIKFNEVEFEAMRIMDKTNDDNYSKYYSSSLSTVIKQGNELITLIYKK